MNCPNCLQAHTTGRPLALRKTARTVAMKSLGDVRHRRGVDRKWQCPECQAIHFEPLVTQPPLEPVHFFIRPQLQRHA